MAAGMLGARLVEIGAIGGYPVMERLGESIRLF
jgi:hypothetical protein